MGLFKHAHPAHLVANPRIVEHGAHAQLLCDLQNPRGLRFVSKTLRLQAALGTHHEAWGTPRPTQQPSSKEPACGTLMLQKAGNSTCFRRASAASEEKCLAFRGAIARERRELRNSPFAAMRKDGSEV